VDEFVEYAYIVCTCRYLARDFEDLAAHLNNGHEVEMVAN
jgi:hypothetical protein